MEGTGNDRHIADHHEHIERSLNKDRRDVRVAKGSGAEKGAHEAWLTSRQASRYNI